MTPTSSLRRTLVAVGVASVLVSTVALDVVLYLSWRSELGDASLGKLVAVEVVATVLAAGLAAVLLHRVAEMVLRPLEKMLEAIRRQTAGQRGERLRPQSCECLLGALGRAYDEMLDAQEQALAETQAARDRSRRFLADAAHQIRTPIAGIQACAETLLRRSRSSDPDEERLLTEMLQETSSAGRLVSDLLHAARLDQGVHLDPTPCDVLAVCRREVQRIQRLEPVLEVTTESPGWNGDRLALDDRAVHDIVANLLDNARRHATSRIRVTVRRGEGTVEVHVADDGPGLAAEHADTVFERFVSLDGQGGSGLGLPIARELARAHGGDLRYEGSEFVVTLPWVPEQASGEVEHRSAGPFRAEPPPAEADRTNLQPRFRVGVGHSRG